MGATVTGPVEEVGLVVVSSFVGVGVIVGVLTASSAPEVVVAAACCRSPSKAMVEAAHRLLRLAIVAQIVKLKGQHTGVWCRELWPGLAVRCGRKARWSKMRAQSFRWSREQLGLRGTAKRRG